MLLARIASQQPVAFRLPLLARLSLFSESIVNPRRRSVEQGVHGLCLWHYARMREEGYPKRKRKGQGKKLEELRKREVFEKGKQCAPAIAHKTRRAKKRCRDQTSSRIQLSFSMARAPTSEVQ